MFHVLFLSLVTVTVMPTLPLGVNTTDVQYDRPMGYFPLALSSASFPLQELGNYKSFVYYGTIVLSGIHVVLGAASSVQAAIEVATPPCCQLISGLFTAIVGLGVTAPFCFSTGYSLLAVLERYGATLPCLALGWAEVVLVFWYYGAGKLTQGMSGNSLFKQCSMPIK